MPKSSIEWTGATWNPIRRNLPHGSSGLPYTAQGGERAELFLDPEILSEPLRRQKPETYFVCSMTDLFQAAHGFELIAAVWGVIAACPQHTFQVLTKRPERARKFFGWCSEIGAADDPGWPHRWCSVHASKLLETPIAGGAFLPWPLTNVWLGTSVENQESAESRIPHLLDCPAAVRFVSYAL